MARLLLNLRNVPDDEIEDVCALLDANGIAHYRTNPSPFGISFGGIWVSEDAEHPRARALMDDYQQARGERVRGERAQALHDGTAETFTSQLRRRPIFVLLVLAGMIGIASLVLLLPLMLLRG